MFVEAVMLEAFQRGLPSTHVINEDASQYDCGQGSKSQEVVYIRGPSLRGPITRIKTADDRLGFYIKSYLQISMGRLVGPLVFLLADDALSPTDFIHIDVMGLTVRRGASTHGSICFTKTRNGNDAFYDWFVESPVSKFIEEVKATEDADFPVLYSMDGEEIQIDAFVRHRERLKELNTRHLKHSASCSALTNALDGGNIHKGSKKVTKHASSDSYFFGNETLQARLDDGLLHHCKHLPKARRDEITDQCLRVMYAIERVTTPEIIHHSFEKVGQLGPDFLRSKMQLCKMPIPKAEAANMRAKFPLFVEFAKSNGGAGIPEAMMDEHNIMCVGNQGDRRTAPKDLRVLTNRRACIANSAGVLADLDTRAAEKLAAPQLREEKKAAIAAKKIATAVKKATIAAEKVEKAALKALGPKKRKKRHFEETVLDELN